MQLVHAPYFDTYVKKVHKDPIELLSDQHTEILNYIELHLDELDYSYADGKWTIREVICHIIDTEIIFVYRLLRIARGDHETRLPGFDQDMFMANTNFSEISDDDLIAWFDAQRTATLALVRNIDKSYLDRTGYASDHEVSAGSLLYMIAGHCEHHLQILRERY